MMIDLLKRHWWLLFVRGVFAIAFGIAIFALDPFFPVPFIRETTFAVLALLFGLFALVCGLLTTIASLRSFTSEAWLLFTDGIAISVAGLLVLIIPSLTFREVIYMIACAAVLAGISEVGIATSLRRQIEHDWLLMTAGIGSVAFGIYLGLAAEHDFVPASLATCVYALVSGLTMAVFAFRLRNAPLRRRAATV